MTPVTADVKLPDTFSIGLSHQFTPETRVLADWSWTGWDAIQDLPIVQATAGVEIDNTELKFENSWRAGLGVEHRPFASVNFITAHDGFTLQDLVSYNDKHNKANGEDNRDGTDDNASWNWGVEGPTDYPVIAELRECQKRNFMAILFLSQGVPMICGGDELSRTQEGNNNAYCQDNELSWFNWTLDRTSVLFSRS